MARGAPAPGGDFRVAMALAYNGSAFHGWQIQANAASVQGRLESALSTILRRPIRIYGSGRTDAGVHALNQIAHCTLPEGTDLCRLRAGLNALAAPAIAVKRLVAVEPTFNARHSAIGKIYRYHIFHRPYPPVLAPDRCWWIKGPVDVGAMEAAASALLGIHDFSAFRAVDCGADSPVRDLSRITLEEREGPDGTLFIEMEASGFLQHMARIIVGTLAAVGAGRLAPADIPAILAARHRNAADVTAPALGLHLVRVRYDLDAHPSLRALTD